MQKSMLRLLTELAQMMLQKKYMNTFFSLPERQIAKALTCYF